MKKSFVKTVCGIVLAGVMLASTGCSMPGASAEDSNDTNAANVVEASDGELFADTTLDAKQVMVMGKVYEIPFNYSNISKQCEKLRLTTVYTGIDMDFSFAMREGNTVLYSIISRFS